MSAWTLKFRDASLESAYKAKVEAEILRPMMVVCLILASLNVSFIPSRITFESRRTDNPFVWGRHDPRTFYFATCAALATYCLLGAVLLFVRLVFGKLAWLNWELITTFQIASFVCGLFCMSSWHTAVFFGVAPEVAWGDENRDSEFVTLLEIIALTTGVSIYVPVRACIMWVIPLCGVVSYVVVVLVVGSPFPGGVAHYIAYLVFLSIVAYQGARHHERQAREMWHHARQMGSVAGKLKDAKQAYEQVASAFCEIVVRLGPSGRVEDSDRMQEAFFGRKMNGLLFSDVLMDCERERFSKVLQEATRSQTIQSMPATLDLHFATSKVQLVVVDANAANAHEPSWLVGIHSSQEQSHSEGAQVDLSRLEDLSIHNERARDPDQDTHMESLPTTTDTGHVFNGLVVDNADGNSDGNSDGNVRTQLESIAEIGKKEHWLISPSEMELVPERTLGTGGFGVVIVGRLRGTPVAVKLPKWSGPGRRPPTLGSINNELRMHRHIRHPNVVLWHGACIHPQSGHLALVYELVDGIQLDHYVADWLGDAEELQKRHKLLMDIACALQFLHTHRPIIVHGDLKPHNVLVERWAVGPRAKILDFGLSQLLTKYAKSQGGTVEWMAPELLLEDRRRQRVAPSADVFSFGRLAYFICTGTKPLAGFQRSLVIHMARQGRPVRLRWAAHAPFMEQCSVLCESCLSHSPEQRPSMTRVRGTLTTWFSMRPTNKQEEQKLDASTLAMSLKGSGWSAGVKAVEVTTGSDLSSEGFGDTAKDRGRDYLMQLEALVERNNLDQPGVVDDGEFTPISGGSVSRASSDLSPQAAGHVSL